MPRSKEANERIRETRKRQILEAATLVYVAKGFHGTEMSEIAREAGVASGLVHYYFASKEKLFQTLFDQMTEQAKAFTRSLLEGEGTPSERLSHLARAYLEAAIEFPEHCSYFDRITADYPLVFGVEGAPLERFEEEFRAPMTEAIAAAIQEGRFRPAPPHLLALLFWNALNGGMKFLMHSPGSKEEKQSLVPEILERLSSLLVGAKEEA